MSKTPSDKTIIRHLKYDLSAMKNERDNYRNDCNKYRIRATQAEQECKEWKQRFDALLMRHGD